MMMMVCDYPRFKCLFFLLCTLLQTSTIAGESDLPPTAMPQVTVAMATVVKAAASDAEPPSGEKKPIKCVECNSYRDGKRCTNWDGVNFIRTCDLEGNVTCSKIDQNVKGEERTIRRCSNAHTELGCIRRVGSESVLVRHCHCIGDMCNPANHLKTPSSLILSMLSLVTGAGLMERAF